MCVMIRGICFVSLTFKSVGYLTSQINEFRLQMILIVAIRIIEEIKQLL